MLKCLYTNADQLTNKRDDLLMTIAHDNPDIIFVTESLPKIQVVPVNIALLALPGYTLFTNFDGSLHHQGIRGICIYTASSIQAAEISFTQLSSIEQLWINIRLKGSDMLTAGCIYRSPSRNAHQSMDELVHLLYTVLAASPSHLLICGDFNIPYIDWINNYCYASESHFSHRFLDIVHDCLLFQHVTQPTRFREGETANVLDLLFTNEEGMLVDLQYLPGLGKSDHIVLKFQLVCYTAQVTSSERLNYNQANWDKLNTMLADVDWQHLNTLDIDSGYKFFHDILSKAVSDSIPTARHSKARKNIYMTSQALQLKKQKNEAWSRYMRTHDPLDLARFRVRRNRLRDLTRSLRRNFESRLVANIKSNPKAFWRYTNSRLKTKPLVGDLRCHTGELVCTDKEKADTLNAAFAGVFTREDLANMPTLTVTAHAVPEIANIEITPERVQGKLRALNPCSAPGPDGIHAHILHNASQTLSMPLALLYRRSLDTGLVPQDWKLGRVVPIFKKGDKKDPNNYRPVSLTAVTCKVLESLIRDQLLQHLIDCHLLSENQHGFRPRRSCNTQLVEVLEDWTKALENHDTLDIMYLDFKKAFDSVPHQRLLHKLRCYGVTGKLLAWIESFLSDRRQNVILNGCTSDWTKVISGVPQGSVLGPLLFLVYINDLPEIAQGRIKMFADDTKLYSTVSSPQDRYNLQDDLDALVRWSDTWQLPFNEEKCKVLHIGHGNQEHQYTMRGSTMNDTQVEKDLGIHIDAELKFRKQASAVVAKATQILAVIRRSFALIDEFTLPLLFKSLVRPHLEYGNLVWGPFNREDQKLVERVQRRATRMVANIRHMPYEKRLQRLRLPSLYYRRRRGDMVFMYQLFHGGLDANPEVYFTLAENRLTRGHPYKVLKQRAVGRVRRSAFSIRSVNDWNALPESVVCSASVNIFKASLDAHWAHLWYLTPD